MSVQTKCPQCGAGTDPEAKVCKYCGEPLAVAAQQTQVVPPQPQVVYVQQAPSQPASPYEAQWPIKSKVTAGVLGILLGGLGIHKFYMGKIGMGVLYLLLCWTSIPSIIGLIEGILYLVSDDHNFQVKNRVRLH